MKRFNTRVFIERAIKRHGNKYDYSRVAYKSADNKIEIVCPEHGSFWQRASSHLRGYGCRKCSHKEKSKAQEYTQEEFIERARGIHGDKYDYSKAEYKGSQTKILIICPKHGEFWQTPSNHIFGKGKGCRQCAYAVISIKNTMTQEAFIEKSVSIHGDKYDYSKASYNGWDSPVVIGCKICNTEFKQRAGVHLGGGGCSNCRGVILKDGTLCDSMIEAFCYLKYREQGVNFEFHKAYGGELGKSKCDFYIPSENLYVETTSFHASSVFGSKHPFHQASFFETYSNKIEKKRKYVEEKLGAKFLYIHKRLTLAERFFVYGHIDTDKNSSTVKNRNKYGIPCIDYDIERAIALRKDGYSYARISEIMGVVSSRLYGSLSHIMRLENFVWDDSAEATRLRRKTGRYHSPQLIGRGRLLLSEFVERSKKIHDSKYDYSIVNYIGTRKKVTIVCPEHGEFQQTPNSHLNGHGCRKCAKSKVSEKHRMTTQRFIERARDVHGDKYDYSEVVFGENQRQKVIIICLIHGKFTQTPHSHLGGRNCRKCANICRGRKKCDGVHSQTIDKRFT